MWLFWLSIFHLSLFATFVYVWRCHTYFGFRLFCFIANLLVFNCMIFYVIQILLHIYNFKIAVFLITLLRRLCLICIDYSYFCNSTRIYIYFLLKINRWYVFISLFEKIHYVHINIITVKLYLHPIPIHCNLYPRFMIYQRYYRHKKDIKKGYNSNINV